MCNVEFTDWEVNFLAAFLGNTLSSDKRVDVLYGKINNFAAKDRRRATRAPTSAHDYSVIAGEAVAPKKSPFQKLLEKNGFKKSVQTLYTIQLGYNRVTVDAENGTCTFEGNRIHPIKNQTDVDMLLRVFSEV